MIVLKEVGILDLVIPISANKWKNFRFLIKTPLKRRCFGFNNHAGDGSHEILTKHLDESDRHAYKDHPHELVKFKQDLFVIETITILNPNVLSIMFISMEMT